MSTGESIRWLGHSPLNTISLSNIITFTFNYLQNNFLKMRAWKVQEVLLRNWELNHVMQQQTSLQSQTPPRTHLRFDKGIIQLCMRSSTRHMVDGEAAFQHVSYRLSIRQPNVLQHLPQACGHVERISQKLAQTSAHADAIGGLREVTKPFFQNDPHMCPNMFLIST